jgi:hypothetical protein
MGQRAHEDVLTNQPSSRFRNIVRRGVKGLLCDNRSGRSVMNSKKNRAAKITAVVTSLLGLGALLGLVRQNPPPAANAGSTTGNAPHAAASTGVRQSNGPMSTPAATDTASTTGDAANAAAQADDQQLGAPMPTPTAADTAPTTGDAANTAAIAGAQQPSEPISTPTAASTAATTGDATPAAAPTSARQQTAPTPTPVTKRHTRTRVS